ncbi:MAG: hypothetical protein OEZ22_00430 [Spirochaetia bacterium]|nr:hypothetical protein [Spirochaetia bacterium]
MRLFKRSSRNKEIEVFFSGKRQINFLINFICEKTRNVFWLNINLINNYYKNKKSKANIDIYFVNALSKKKERIYTFYKEDNLEHIIIKNNADSYNINIDKNFYYNQEKNSFNLRGTLNGKYKEEQVKIKFEFTIKNNEQLFFTLYSNRFSFLNKITCFKIISSFLDINSLGKVKIIKEGTKRKKEIDKYNFNNSSFFQLNSYSQNRIYPFVAISSTSLLDYKEKKYAFFKGFSAKISFKNFIFGYIISFYLILDDDFEKAYGTKIIDFRNKKIFLNNNIELDTDILFFSFEITYKNLLIEGKFHCSKLDTINKIMNDEKKIYSLYFGSKAHSEIIIRPFKSKDVLEMPYRQYTCSENSNIFFCNREKQ